MKTTKIFLSITLILNSYLTFCQVTNEIVKQQNFKTALVLAIENKDITDSLYQLLSNIPSKNAIVLGNLGSLEALKGKHALNPFSKLKYVKSGISKLNKAIQIDNNNLELRFMRFTVEYYTPSFLGLSIHKTEDKNKMIQLIQKHNRSKGNSETASSVAQFLIKNKLCSPNERLILEPYAKI